MKLMRLRASCDFGAVLDLVYGLPRQINEGWDAWGSRVGIVFEGRLECFALLQSCENDIVDRMRLDSPHRYDFTVVHADERVEKHNGLTAIDAIRLALPLVEHGQALEVGIRDSKTECYFYQWVNGQGEITSWRLSR